MGMADAHCRRQVESERNHNMRGSEGCGVVPSAFSAQFEEPTTNVVNEM